MVKKITRGIPILFIDLNITILGIVLITDYSYLNRRKVIQQYLSKKVSERKDLAYKCKIFKAIVLYFIAIVHVCTVFRVIGINKENKVCQPNRECKLVIDDKK